jgi:hypothetical protein
MLEFIKELVSLNISVWVDGNDLEISFGDEMPSDDLFS